MAVAFDKVSESHTGTTGATSVASFTWTHTPVVGAPRGVVVFVFSGNGSGATSGEATSVTYGGTAVPAVAGGKASDTAGVPGVIQTYFLGGGVPTGARSVVVNRNNNVMQTYAVAITLSASSNTSVFGIPVLLQEDGTYSEQSVNSGSITALRIAAGYSGDVNVLTMGANTTTTGASGQIDFGSYTFTTGYETTGGSGSRSVGFSLGTSTDRAAVHLAIGEAIQSGSASGTSISTSDATTATDISADMYSQGTSQATAEGASTVTSDALSNAVSTADGACEPVAEIVAQILPLLSGGGGGWDESAIRRRKKRRLNEQMQLSFSRDEEDIRVIAGAASFLIGLTP